MGYGLMMWEITVSVISHINIGYLVTLLKLLSPIDTWKMHKMS